VYVCFFCCQFEYVCNLPQLNAWAYLKDLPEADRKARACAMLQCFALDHLAAPLLKVFDDPVESCRVSAIELFSTYGVVRAVSAQCADICPN
jgi:hypothetical protein